MQNVNLSVLFLASTVPVWVAIVIGAVVLICALVFFFVYKKVTESKIGSVNARADKILADAETEADQIRAQGKEESNMFPNHFFKDINIYMVGHSSTRLLFEYIPLPPPRRRRGGILPGLG